MKPRAFILAALVTVFSASAVATMAQSSAEPAIKVLPTNQKGIIKVLFAYDTQQPVTVKFYADGDLVGTDNIKTKSLKKGFTKKYDVSNINSQNFTMEISSDNVSVTYQILESEGTLSYAPFLLKTTYNYALTASNHID